MNCQHCQKSVATVHVTEVVQFVRPQSPDNRLRELHVCDQCARKLNLPHAVSQAAPLDIWKLLQLNAKKVRIQGTTLRCKACGMTLDELRRNGKLGCAQDYEVFKDYLHELLERMHGALEHVGRVPGIGEGELERIQRVQELQASLELAVRQEDYEEAASIRDELKLLQVEADDSTI
ncbi:MAG: hypothetical protein GY711_05950 [bacterium]|nr:hypothetical protein [bacterium]